MNHTPRPAYQGPPDYRAVGRHGVFPQTSHDEVERFNFLAQMNRHLGARVLPGVKAAFEHRVAPRVHAAGGRFETRHDVREALLEDPYYQTWSALRRMTMEQRQQAGRWVAIRQAEELAARVSEVIEREGGFACAIRHAMAPLARPRAVTAVVKFFGPGARSVTRAPSVST